MNPLIRFALIVGSACLLSASAWAGGPEAPASPTQAQLKREWEDVKASLRQGAYRPALQSLEVLLTLTPDDPWAQLYHSLCELRLESPPPFQQLSHDQLQALEARLRDEERLQRRAAVQQKALDRQVRKEQLRWDRELDLLERQAEREQQQRRQQAQAQAVSQARSERIQSRELAQQEALQAARAGALAPHVPSEAPAAEQPAQVVSSGAGAPTPTVELAPVTVSTTLAQPPVSPSLVGRPTAPAGAVQINARQMSVSPDRKIAIAEGDVEVVFENAYLTCDHLTLFTDTKDVYAEGRVRLEEGSQVFRGEMAHYNLETKKGRFLQGTISSPPWHEHGRSVEHIAEGVYEVNPGYLTSCELEPPHFKFYGRRAIVFADDRLARARNVALVVEQLPFFYLPWVSFSERQSPFFLVPGKHKLWGPFALMGYRYDLPGVLGDGGTQQGAIRLDWRRYFGWGVGLDHELDSPRWGNGLLKLYFNEEQNLRVQDPKATLPKGAAQNRYRILWRHRWEPMPNTTIVTDYQKYSDVDFRKDLLFREEYIQESTPESFISLVRNDPDFTLTTLVRKRVNRFQTVTEAFPDFSIDARQQRIGETNFFTSTTAGIANLQTKNAHSETDTDVVRVDWTQGLSYGLSWFAPVEITPKVNVRQTYYTKDIQGGPERPDGKRDLISGQFSGGVDSSLKLFRIFPVTTNALGLNLHGLRHVVTPTVSYAYTHRPTVPNEILNFATAGSPGNGLTFELENKLQTKRPVAAGKLRTLDLVRLVTSAPYTFRSTGNKRGGRLGDWAFDLETYPWPWLRLESDWSIPSHFVKGSRDQRIPAWNVDLVMVGGEGTPLAQSAPDIQAPVPQAFQAGPRGGLEMMPQGQWYLGLGHRFSANDKTESVAQFDWRLSKKWQIGTFHRLTWKEVAEGSKRFNNMREYQYTLRRDLHDWIAELVYRVDREFGEELFFTLTLKAYPNMPIELEDSYHQPKFGSQSSPFSPLRGAHPTPVE